MTRDFRRALSQGPIVFDGAMGTMLQRLGLKPGGCPEELNLTGPGLVKKVHAAYIEAGSDVVTTNTFGGNRVKLKEYGLEAKTAEINRTAARIAREAAGDGHFVAGDIGPTGFFLEPVGEMAFDEAVDLFREQARALKEGGADLLLIETMMDIKEMKAAIIGSKDTGLPVLATMTFDETKRTVLGTPPESFAIMAEALGVAALGANCSLGIEGIVDVVSDMARVVSIPLMAQPNAGIPVLRQGKTVFPATPDEMAERAGELAGLGVRILGGCCGTTPEHIEKMARAFRAAEYTPPSKKTFGSLSSRTSYTLFGADLPTMIIGERINPTGKKTFALEIKEGKTSRIRKEAREQKGAHALDVNVGVPGVDERAAMRMAVFVVNENTNLPLVIDSSNPEAMEEGLKASDGKALVNSISGEEKKLAEILPLAVKYGAAVLGLALDDSGIPDSAEGRLRVAERILEACLKAGIRREDILIDCLAMTVSAMPESALVTLDAIRLVREKLGLPTVLGVSNISFGLPARPLINASFLSMAMAAGLNAAIINPKDFTIMDAYHASLVLAAKDARAERYIDYVKTRPLALSTGKGAKVEAGPEEKRKIRDIRDRIKYAVIDGDEENIVALVEEALAGGLDPVTISNEALIPGLDEVGKLFATNRYFLPQVMLSAETMKKAFGRLKKEMKGRKGPTLGKVLLATVEGDIHDIGKNIVATLLENHGFEVIDLGKNVPAERIVATALREKVDVVGLSALMTTTVMEMGKVIEKLREKGIKVATIVGGAVVSDEFSRKIGADAYGGDALSAVEKIKKLVGKK